ncbi:MAG: type II toxin-antitoxin system VapC family toxin [Acidobacteriota bacterium]|nr:type II toxin-antitoxin system VapC family toxin [Acidobacteriota bacterium]
MSVERLVIDSCVAIKWRLRDESELAQADALQEDFVNGRVELLAPTLFDYEIGNILKVAISRKRLSEADAVIALADFKTIALERFGVLPLQSRVFDLAIHYQRSFYDASYLALAENQGVDFYTGDKRLFNAVNSFFPWVKWIGDYPV